MPGRDYDDWATLTGDAGWSFASMRPYIAKHQTLIPHSPSSSSAAVQLDAAGMATVAANHGFAGPIHTTWNTTRLPLEDAWIRGADETFGIADKPADAWGGDHYGFYNGLGSVHAKDGMKGKRCYAARGYLEANAARPNLRVLCEAQVARILLEGGEGEGEAVEAVGAAFAWGGERFEVKARKEVLLCAGAIHSPAVLEWSGIGDPEVLRRAGVECKVELSSVGENFQDHVLSGLGYKMAPGQVSGDSLYHPDAMAAAQKAYVEGQDGPLAAVVSGQGFVR
ncbi:hypothetical protein SLS55_010384 [Diplodia seriata]|uniref:Glucose-methanol-choline oxidoreductase N-terminal domain-containing protein n=1 Tax=Diplodia seriata TaxID=420778 RepID=A0ABR3BYE3_9PEZI